MTPYGIDPDSFCRVDIQLSCDMLVYSEGMVLWPNNKSRNKHKTTKITISKYILRGGATCVSVQRGALAPPLVCQHPRDLDLVTSSRLGVGVPFQCL